MKKSRAFIAFLAVIIMVSSLPISAVNLVEKDNVSTTSIKESTLPETLSYETALSRGIFRVSIQKKKS